MNLEALLLTVVILGAPALVGFSKAWLERRRWSHHPGGPTGYIADCLMLAAPLLLVLVFGALLLIVSRLGSVAPGTWVAMSGGIFAAGFGLGPAIGLAWGRLKRARKAAV